MARFALVAFNGDGMCFAHVLLNALDMKKRGHEVSIIIEGSACRQIGLLADPEAPFAVLWSQVKQAGLIGAVCKACSAKMGSLESAQAQELPIDGGMNSHPSLAQWLEQDWDVITF